MRGSSSFAASTIRATLGKKSDSRQTLITAAFATTHYIKKKKKLFSVSTTIKLNFLLKAVRAVALDRDLIRKLPRIIGLLSPVKRQPEPMTIDQIKILIRASDKSRYSPILWLELSTGLRRGEILALEWTDLSGNSLSVTKSLEVTSDKGLVVQPPKQKPPKQKPPGEKSIWIQSL